jgi:MipA family protein
MPKIISVVIASTLALAPMAAFAQQAPTDAAQEDEYAGIHLTSTRRLPVTVFDDNWVQIGIGLGYRPSYSGSDDYKLFPAPALRGSVSGFDFQANGPGLEVDLIRHPDGQKIEYILGPSARARTDRNGGVKDPVVKLLGKRDVAAELGVAAGVKINRVLIPPANLTLSVDALWDVAGAHNGRTIKPQLSFSSPLSNAAFASLSLSAEHIDGNFARTYYSIDTAGSTASGLPVFNAKGGWKNVGTSALFGYDLSGNGRDGGFALFGLVNYSRLTGDAKRSPVTSIRGSANQWFVAAGVSYTF